LIEKGRRDLKSIAARSGFRISKKDPNFHSYLIYENNQRIGFGNRGRQFSECLSQKSMSPEDLMIWPEIKSITPDFSTRKTVRGSLDAPGRRFERRPSVLQAQIEAPGLRRSRLRALKCDPKIPKYPQSQEPNGKIKDRLKIAINTLNETEPSNDRSELLKSKIFEQE
jgi:hypothetical protein